MFTAEFPTLVQFLCKIIVQKAFFDTKKITDGRDAVTYIIMLVDHARLSEPGRETFSLNWKHSYEATDPQTSS